MDAGPQRPGDGRLRLAWWNTGLVPLKRGHVAVEPERARVAAEVVAHMIGVEGVAFVGLGEVTPAVVDTIRGAVTATPCQSFSDDREIPEGRHLGAVFDRTRLELVGESKLTTIWGGNVASGGLHLIFLAPPATDPLHVFVMHWPSRMIADQEYKRRLLGTFLQQQIEQLTKANAPVRPAIAVLGDFNDEPYDESLHAHLLGTRDRNLARRNPTRLYNPFWRHLGERQCLEEESAGRLAAGSYSGRTLSSDWHTFDQALVSGRLLTGPGWTLVERSTGIWQKAPLLKETGAILDGFDHFPIIVTLNAAPAAMSGGSNG